MIKRCYAVVGAALLFAAMAPVALAAEGDIGNGGFESPAHGGSYLSLGAGDTRLAPWEIGGAGVESVGSLWEPGEGTYSIDLNSTDAGSVAQDIETLGGKTYTLSFEFTAAGSEGPAIKTMDVYWEGTKAQSFNVDSTNRTFSSMGWTKKTLQLTAGDSSSRLEFRSTTTASRAGPTIDDVKMLQGAFSPETLQLDSRDNDDDGASGPISTSASLTSGATYIVTVDGTFSTWEEETWDNPGACGSPESEPENPSSGTANGPVSSDAEFLLAEPAWGGQNCSDPIPRHDGGPFQIDTGSGISHREPLGGEPSSPTSDHVYRYRITGEGQPVQFALVEDPTSDNYGMLTITVESEAGEDDPPPECGDAGAICGGSADEELQGTPEDEFIFGGGGNDDIDGGGGDDVILGGSGNDSLTGGPGKDRIVGGSGKDRIVGDATRGSGSASRSGVIASQAAGAADQLAGGGGNDSVLGGGGSDQVAGGSGEDKILGEAGNDKLKGDAGNDLLRGGGGVNDFNGGPGRDHCVLDNRRDETQSCEKKTRNFTRNFWP